MPHASNAPNAACGSCFSLKTACLDKPSALAMADKLGGLAVSWCLAVNHSLPVRALQSAMSSMTDFSHSQKVGKTLIISYEFPPWVQIPVHRDQPFRRIADSVPVIADSFR